MFILSQRLLLFFSFSCLILCQVRRCTEETGREHSWYRWPELTQGLFHTVEHHVQYINWGFTQKGPAGLRKGVWHWSVGGEHRIVHHLFFPFLLSLLLLFTIIVLFYFSIIKLFSSQHTSITLILLPIPLGWEKRGGRLSKWLRGISSPAGFKTMAVLFGAQHTPQRVEIRSDLTRVC